MKSDRQWKKIAASWPAAVVLGALAEGCHRAPPAPREQALRTVADVRRDYEANRRRLKGEDNADPKLKVGPFDLSGVYVLVVELPQRVYRLATNDTPGKAARAMEDSSNADERRRGILKLAGFRFGRQDVYTKRYNQIADNDPDPGVRAAALRALDRSRFKPAVPLYVRGMENDDVGIRLESAKALANIPDDAGVAPLIRHLNNAGENKDVRIACADALRNFKTIEAARALVGVLNDRDFGIAWQARKSLNLLSGRDFRYDESAWLAFLNSDNRPFG